LIVHRRYQPNSTIAQAGDFLRLGLRYGESSAWVIRSAVRASIHRLIDGKQIPETSALDSQLSLIATSAYRLLDPRFRTQLYERVQLSFPIDRDDNRPIRPITTGDIFALPSSTHKWINIDEEPAEFSEEDLELSTLEDAREIVRFIRRAEAAEAKTPPKKSFSQRVRRSLRNLLRPRVG
jgi:hypothetical protein